jgi:NTP pyrophosphatase (non-canonical NTP hydrolase)
MKTDREKFDQVRKDWRKDFNHRQEYAMPFKHEQEEIMSNKLTLETYQALATKTLKKDAHYLSEVEQHVMGNCLGLAGEAGEFIDLVKKLIWHEQGSIFAKTNHDKLIKELGDVLWYVSALATLLEVPLEEVASLNIQKLQKRYQNGFNTEDSLAKKDEKVEDIGQGDVGGVVDTEEVEDDVISALNNVKDVLRGIKETWKDELESGEVVIKVQVDNNLFDVTLEDDFTKFCSDLYQSMGIDVDSDITNDTDSPATDTSLEDGDFIDDTLTEEGLEMVWGDDEDTDTESIGYHLFNDIVDDDIEDEEEEEPISVYDAIYDGFEEDEEYDTWDEGEQYQVGDNGFGDEDDE